MERYDAQGRKLVDDFAWDSYTRDYYSRELEDAHGRGEVFLLSRTLVSDGHIDWRDNVHPHIRALCEDVVASGVSSAFECGCAGGHNLACIRHVAPGVSVAGCDRSESQIREASRILGVPEEVRRNLVVCNLVVASPA